MLVRKQKFEKI